MTIETVEKKRYPKPADFKPESVFPPDHKKAGQKRCQAWNPNTGRQCELNPITGKTKCGSHGGKTPRGAASANFRNGRYSKYLPDRLAADYQRAQEDIELLSLREEIALIDARIADLLKRVDTGESAEIWPEVKRAVAAYKVAVVNQDAQRMGEMIALIEQIARTRASDAEAWDGITKLLAQRQRLVESERKRQVEQQLMITIEEGMLLISAIGEEFRQSVLKYCEVETARKILYDSSAAVERYLNKSLPAVIDGEPRAADRDA